MQSFLQYIVLYSTDKIFIHDLAITAVIRVENCYWLITIIYGFRSCPTKTAVQGTIVYSNFHLDDIYIYI